MSSTRTVHSISCCLGWGIAFAFLCDNMNENRAWCRHSFHLVENGDQIIDVMTVNWPYVIQSQLFKQSRPRSTKHPSSVFINLSCYFMCLCSNLLSYALYIYISNKINFQQKGYIMGELI